MNSVKKVAICGMTAPQISTRLQAVNRTFTSDVADALRSRGVAVDFINPKIENDLQDLAQYDSVLVGLAPVLSMSSNSAYSALATIGKLYGSDGLKFFVDAPEPSKIHASTRSIMRDPSRLTKDLYRSRANYRIVSQNKAAHKLVLRGVEVICNEKWPTTLYPELPWQCELQIDFVGLPKSATDSMTGIQVDAVTRPVAAAINSAKGQIWAVENRKSRWYTKVEPQLEFPTVDTKDSRKCNDGSVFKKLVDSWGLVIGPHDDKILWWSPRFLQAMNAGTVIVTEWRDSGAIGDAWRHIAPSVERMSKVEAYELSLAQKAQYFRSLKSHDEVIDNLMTTIGVR